MRIFYRLLTVIKSYINFFIGKVEDPEKILDQLILDMQDRLIKAKQQVSISIADEKKLKNRFEEENLISIQWEKRATLAVKSGMDDLAKEALGKKLEHDELVNVIEKQWMFQKDSVEKLKDSLNILYNKIVDAKRKRNLLVSRAKRAQAQKTISETMSDLSKTNAASSLERMEDNINRLEAEASATTEIVNEISFNRIDKTKSKLETAELNKALLSLKKKIKNSE